MAVRDRSRRRTGSRTATGRGLSRYDVYLVAIPFVFLVGAVLASIAGVSLRGTMLAASLLSVAILADGLFVNPPEVGGS